MDRPARPPHAVAADALTEAFLAALTRRRATGEAVARDEVAARAAAHLASLGVTRALVASDPLLDDAGVPAALANAGVEVLRALDGHGWAELMGLEGPFDTCGVTAPVAAVAERGTLLLAAAPAHPRALDVVSRHHLAILPAERIVPTLADALAGVYRAGGSPPSALSLVSGPSRSSDIEKISTLGAHGALSEHVIVAA
jgi:L-lactate dehydrogenase complex protein LldG